MTSTVLFAPQNDSHAETVALLAPELERRGVDAVVLDLDGIYQQGTARYLQGIPSIASGLSSERPFYRLPPRAQLRVVAQARRRVPRWIDGFDAFVAFNDGAIQRLLFAGARRRGVPTDLVLDGMITFVDERMSVRWAVRRGLRELGRLLDGTEAGAFFPSEVGLAGVDRTHVGGEHSARVLRERRSRALSILASGLPRWPDPEWNSPAAVKNVLYLTGAFRWHNDPATSEAQQRDVRLIAAMSEKLGLPLTIRVHPRDEPESYRHLPAVITDPHSESMADTIRRSDLVLSLVSTGLIDAVVLGKPARAVAVHPDWRRYRRSFVSDPLFGAVRDAGQLQSTLAALSRTVALADLECQRASLARYVAATGGTAARTIAKAIAESIAQ